MVKETESPEGRSSSEVEPIELVHQYLEVLRGDDLQVYELSQGMLDDIFYDNISTHGSREVHTWWAFVRLSHYLVEGESEKREKFDAARKQAAIHVVRSMVQGNKFPVDQFGAVIYDVLGTLAAIDGTKVTREHKRCLRKEVRDILSFERGRSGNPDIVRRAAEVYKFVGRPRTYGRLAARAVRLGCGSN